MMRTLSVYDPAMCCSSGVCGPDVDPELARFAGTLQAIGKKGTVTVERFNLAQQPQAFVANGEVKSLLAKDGKKVLPLIFVDAKLAFEGRYPSREELFVALGLQPEAETDGGGCCGGCCG